MQLKTNAVRQEHQHLYQCIIQTAFLQEFAPELTLNGQLAQQEVRSALTLCENLPEALQKEPVAL